MRTERIYTRRDAEKARQAHDYSPAELRRLADEREAAEKLAAVMLNPEIGMLMRKGKLVYYVNFPTYREARDPRDLT